MVARLFRISALALLCAVVPGARAADSEEPGRRLAERLETMLAKMTETAYQARTEIDEETGSLKCDCSGLVGYLLRKLYPEAYLSLRGEEAPWRSRPMAVTYYETFFAAAAGTGNGRWLAVDDVMDLRPGDFLAWRKETIEEVQSSGHVCMVAGEPAEEPDGRVRVRVIDSTSGPHSNDARTEQSLGVGSGDMYFQVGRDGRATGFYVRGDGPMNPSAFAFARVVDLGDQPSPVVDAPADADFAGLEVDEAEALARQRNLDSQVIENDGAPTPVGMGINSARINFVVRGGRVVRTLRG